jgi:hypothetical protein
MTTNISTIYVKRYYAKQVAMGLCRHCPNPLAPGSVQLCQYHIDRRNQKGLTKRMQNGSVPNFVRAAAREAIVNVFRQDPKTPIILVMNQFHVTKSFAYKCRTTAVGMPPQKQRRVKVATLLREHPDMSFEDIAKATGVSEGTMYLLAKEFGYPTRIRRPYNLKRNAESLTAQISQQ